MVEDYSCYTKGVSSYHKPEERHRQQRSNEYSQDDAQTRHPGRANRKLAENRSRKDYTAFRSRSNEDALRAKREDSCSRQMDSDD